MVRRFFQDYKKLERKEVQVDQIQASAQAFPIIAEALAAYKKEYGARHSGDRGAK
jgi:inorganic pyrophosphatase